MLASVSLVRHCASALVATLAVAASACAATAADYPNKPIRVIVTHSPGSSADTVARMVIPGMAHALGQAMVIENEAGLSGIIGATQVARAPKDGYTLGVVSLNFAINPSLNKVPYDTLKDIAPVSIMTSGQALLVVNAKVPANNLQQLIALANSRSDKSLMTYGSPGVGSVFHLAFELMASATGTKWLHIPYKASSGFTTDLVGGQIDAGFVSPGLAVPLIKSGKLRPIGVAGAVRVNVLPDIPTLAESGIPGYNVNSWIALIAPAGTPDAVIRRLNTEAAKALHSKAVVASLAAVGFGVTASSPEEAAVIVREDLTKYARVVKDAHIKVN
jgi:tripartite-type tricarboxylate transporter receptor subunit TctC